MSLLLTCSNLNSLLSWNAGYISINLSIACLALSTSTHKWHKAALKKYSFALYFNKGLSNDVPATLINRNITVTNV